MKLLVIALDGGDSRIIQKLKLPFLSRTLLNNNSVKLKEDLFSRGWAESLTGLHGNETGAFYTKPLLDGTHNETQKFGIKDYNKSGVNPIWKRLNKDGWKVGFMTLNTVMPPPKVEGFFVAGPGGGFKAGKLVPEEACFPKDIHEVLLKHNNYWEIRYKASGITDFKEFFEAIKHAVKSRVESFLELSNTYQIDFGYIFHKAPVVVQNLFMVEIEKIIEQDGKAETDLQHEILDFYHHLDEQCQIVLTKAKPQDFIIYSDHGAAPYEYSMNINAFLTGKNFMKQSKMAAARSLISKAQQKIFKKYKRRISLLKENPNNSIFDWSKTKAFGIRYVSGVYINDERFHGPVKEADKANLIEKIITAINMDEASINFGIRAEKYIGKNQSDAYNKLLPDIWLNIPNNIFNESKGKKFIYNNPNYRRLDSLEGINKDLYSGVKGSTPILCTSYKIPSAIKSDNLTIVYELINNIMNS